MAELARNSQIPTSGSGRRGVLERAVEHLQAMIDLRRVLPGESLPSAQTLGQELGINRVTVLESLHVLERQGLITLRPGPGGAKVIRCEQRPIEQRRTRAMVKLEHLHDLAILHDIVETGIAARAATVGLPIKELRRGRRLLEQLGLETDRDLYLRRDLEFHDLLASATGSRKSAALSRRLRHKFIVGLDAISLDREFLQRSNKQHEQILEAIGRKDPAQATRWTRAHAKDALDLISGALHIEINPDGSRDSVASEATAGRQETQRVG